MSYIPDITSWCILCFVELSDSVVPHLFLARILMDSDGQSNDLRTWPGKWMTIMTIICQRIYPWHWRTTSIDSSKSPWFCPKNKPTQLTQLTLARRALGSKAQSTPVANLEDKEMLRRGKKGRLSELLKLLELIVVLSLLTKLTDLFVLLWTELKSLESFQDNVQLCQRPKVHPNMQPSAYGTAPITRLLSFWRLVVERFLGALIHFDPLRLNLELAPITKSWLRHI